jgi:hypothetical protein
VSEQIVQHVRIVIKTQSDCGPICHAFKPPTPLEPAGTPWCKNCLRVLRRLHKDIGRLIQEGEEINERADSLACPSKL